MLSSRHAQDSHDDPLQGNAATARGAEERDLDVPRAADVREREAADAVKGVTPGGTGRLGYSAWLGKQPTPQPRGDLVFRAES